MWFSSFSCKFSFLILPDSKVSQLLMNLLLSYSALQLQGRPREAGAGISKESMTRCSSWVAARVSKPNRSQRKCGCLCGGFSRTWAVLTQIQYAITKYLKKSAVHLTPLVSWEGRGNALSDALQFSVIDFTLFWRGMWGFVSLYGKEVDEVSDD